MNILTNFLDVMVSLVFFLTGLIYYKRTYSLLKNHRVSVSPKIYIILTIDKLNTGIMKIRGDALSYDVLDMMFSYLYCYIVANGQILKINRLTSKINYISKGELPVGVKKRLDL